MLIEKACKSGSVGQDVIFVHLREHMQNYDFMDDGPDVIHEGDEDSSHH